ncbi:helix-turn-helix domain-containing protein [Oceanobacter sp. 5_MG-2023]|uniref:AraC family transcriptional regulator n=2 Tax=Gammaproteobacteria TaxID=1236 RepID=UPI0026E12521|nr:helix-turn-helix domain-containing protein [Oceanobacter sp. 5_MG-2023]MDO6681857.1 helix-turn-helix domain-containing protein [Oceanobacter sp. 5_MG-2023]
MNTSVTGVQAHEGSGGLAQSSLWGCSGSTEAIVMAPENHWGACYSSWKIQRLEAVNGVRQQQTLAAATLELLLCERGFPEVSVGTRVYRMVPGQSLLLMPGQSRLISSDTRTRLVIASVQQGNICHRALELGLVLPAGNWQQQAPLNPSTNSQLLLGLATKMLDSVEPLEGICRHCFELMEHCILDLWEFPGRPMFQRQPLLDIRLQHCRDYMLARLDQEFLLEPLASQLALTVRSLYRLFRIQLNQTPTEYFRHLRLEAVYMRLSQPGLSKNITQVAMEYGFVNMGRFARQYRDYLGELPSETVRQSR